MADLQRQEELETEEKETLEKRQKRKSKLSKSNLSFGDDLEEGAAEGEPETKKKIIKNPTVNTSFLPDRERELQEIEERKRLTETWHQEQDLKKQEVPFFEMLLHPELVNYLLHYRNSQVIEITYSYWDGSGHRRSIKTAKGSTIGQFLEQCRKQLMVYVLTCF